MDQKVEDIIENIKALSPDDYNLLIRALPLLRKDETTERIADFANSLKLRQNSDALIVVAFTLCVTDTGKMVCRNSVVVIT